MAANRQRVLNRAVWLLLLASLFPLSAQAQTAVDLELALGIDVSRSIDNRHPGAHRRRLL
jgi:hypothetical protein